MASGRRMGRWRAASARLPRGTVPRERHAPGGVGRRARGARRAHAAHLRSLRRAAARPAGRVDHAAVRADGARRQAVRPRRRRRQGAGVLSSQGDRGRGRPPVNFRFLIEGEEEYGSRVLFELLRREPERTRADAVLIADMAYIAPRWPAVYTTLRGLCYAEITVRTAKSDLHSGEFGGAAPNAHEELARLLGRLKTPDGKVHVPGLYASVKRPSKVELATWKRLPFKEGEFLKHRVQAKALTGLKSYSVLERLWALPTFEIHGITGGFTGDGAKTVIPAEATAKVSLRLVPDQKLKVVERQLSAAVRRLAPKHVQASVKFLHGADPATVKVTHPAFKLLDQAFREVVGRGTVPARAGGSIPVVPALGKGGAPVILTGIGLPDDRLHAPNEKLDLKQLWDGIRVFGRFYELLASL